MTTLRRALRLLPLLFCLFGYTLHAQDVDARSPKQTMGGSKQQKIAEKKKLQQKKKAEKAIEKGKKQHQKIQSKNTRKMMRKSKHSSHRWNENKREFFLKRWFRKKSQ